MDASIDNPHYFMRVVIEPRQAVRPGQLLQPPLIVSLHELERKPTETQRLVNGVRENETPPTEQARSPSKGTVEQRSAPPNLESLWAFVHLVPEMTPDSEAMYHCDRPKLSGVLADTLEEPLNRGADEALGYFKFEDLTISDA
ncbi:MAG: hypothetical protein Q9191_005059, partial [Dirinaria sp. TL-2023a]